MINFNEAYYCKADAKGRVMLPSALKNRLLPVLNEGFVLKRSVSGACLELWPMAQWNEMMLKIKKLNRFVKKNNDFIRIFMAGVKEVEVDNAGRLLIPKNLMSIAGIVKEIALSPSVDIIEIWDKDSYEKAIEITDDDFEVLAEEVMGGLGENIPDVS
ncbi:division/cell wall cluster transcriptional repressor MraZ [Maribacter polysaccharolyticus]|uniref:division/cell wall cluster transcriptional repressor MraZ n=1 Tax=Maribacter polysaccharolyticus TaxID=3020831 RepID=UPI00237F0CCD|nr:division/cell wall cluster transcriptional repressor MraZ [Maribacter polysaccharolyticus]MDE3743678.1 division/cell wall cluster transcriptional repressor MraZ [Maribacter polysaccharolyticus]